MGWAILAANLGVLAVLVWREIAGARARREIAAEQMRPVREMLRTIVDFQEFMMLTGRHTKALNEQAAGEYLEAVARMRVEADRVVDAVARARGDRL